MKRTRTIEGSWTGRLIDIQGFEGEFFLELKQNAENKVYGTFRVIIRDEEALLIQEGATEGTVLKDTFDIVFVPKNKEAVKIRMEGRVQDLREEGLGLRATYDVSGKTLSPFQGGIASARTIKSLPSVRISERSRFKDI